MSGIALHERMVWRIAQEVRNHGVVVMGSFTPLAYASYMLAKLTHAPDVVLVGYNAVDMEPLELSYLGTEAAAYRTSTSRLEAMAECNSIHLSNRGMVEAISPAQLDGTGAFNTSAIGDYARPAVRLPGVAGAPEVVQMYERIVAYFGHHSPRHLVPKVDFVSGNRWKISDESRRSAGMLTGPIVVVTNLCVLQKEEDDTPFRLASLHPGVDADTVVRQTGFEIDVPSSVPQTGDPDAHSIELLRHRIDPQQTARIDILRGEERKAHMRSILNAERQRAQLFIENSKKRTAFASI